MTGEAKAMRQNILKGYYLRHNIKFTNSDIELMSRAQLNREIKKLREKYGKGR